MIKVYFILYLLRFHNLIIAGLAVLVSSYLINEPYQNPLIFKLIIVITLTLGLANIMNNFFDVKADNINIPDRSMLSNYFKKKQRLICAIFIGIVMFYSISFNFTSKILLFGIIFPFIISYNIYFKKQALIGNMIVSLLLGSIFLFSELVVKNEIEKTYIPFCLAFLLTLIREITKDLEDYKGDRSAKMKTLPIIIGKNKTNYFLIMLIIISMVVFIVPYIYFDYSQEYIYLLAIFIEIPLLYFLFLIVSIPSKNTYSEIARMLKGLNFIGLLIIMYTKQ